MQLDKQSRRHPARYESGLWSKAEKRYDAGKRECRRLLKMLKKVRYYLYGVRFVIETDAKTLVAQLNKSASDIPGARDKIAGLDTPFQFRCPPCAWKEIYSSG
jgi:hypothetical protein